MKLVSRPVGYCTLVQFSVFSTLANAGNSGALRSRGPTGGVQAELLGEMHQLGHRSGLHLLHDMGAVSFDGSFRRTQLRRDLFVEPSDDDAREHIALERSWWRSGAQRFAVVVPLTPRYVALDRVRNRPEQYVALDRFRQEIDGAGLHGAHAGWNIAVPGEKDDRQMIVAFAESFLQFQAARSGHPDIENDASWLVDRRRQQHCARGGIAANTVPGRIQRRVMAVRIESSSSTTWTTGTSSFIPPPSHSIPAAARRAR